MAATAATTGSTAGAVVPWQQAIAAVNAMPGGPSWKEVERRVDEALSAEMNKEEPGLRATNRLQERYMNMLGTTEVPNRWIRLLNDTFPAVYEQIRLYPTALGQLGRVGPTVWFLLRCFPGDVRLQFEYIRHEWMFLKDGEQTYALERMPLSILHRLQQQQRDALYLDGDEPREPNAMEQRRDQLFEADVDCAIHKRTAGVASAHSDIVDSVAALHGADVARHVAHLLVPAAGAAAASSSGLLPVRHYTLRLQHLRATLNTADRPELVLARAIRQIDRFIDDVSSRD